MNEDDIETGEFEAVELDDEGTPVIPVVSEDWLWRMQGAVSQMHKKKGFEVRFEENFRPAAHVVKETLQSAAGMTVPTTIASLWDITDGYELGWLYVDEESGEQIAAGDVHIFGYGDVFGSWLGKLWGEHPEDASEAEIDFTWEIRGFDAAGDHSPYGAVFHVAEVLPRYDLFWHAPHEKTYPIRVDFLEYLECLVETRGLHGWQYMVCDVDLQEDDEALERVRECTRLMRKLFPEVDLSRYTTVEEDQDNDE